MMDEKGLDEEAGMGVMKCENTKDRKDKKMTPWHGTLRLGE